MKCKICDMEFKSNIGFSRHVRIIHDMSLLDYKIKYENFETPKCPICNEDRKFLYSKFQVTCGNENCVKALQRRKRFNYLKKRTGETAWERRNSGKMSEFEEWAYDKILENKLEEKYDIINEFSEYPYFIDFAFVNEKIALELDGYQHFMNKKNRKKDKIRDECLKDKGWIMYHISYLENKEDAFNKFLNWLNDPVNPKVFGDKIYKYKEVKKKIKKKKLCKMCGIKINISSKEHCKKCSHIFQRRYKWPSKEELKELLKKNTMVSLGKKFGVSDNAVKKLAKKYELM